MFSSPWFILNTYNEVTWFRYSMRKKPWCLGRLVFSIFILFYQTKNVLTPNVSIVRVTIFISGLNNEKVKVKASIYTTH